RDLNPAVRDRVFYAPRPLGPAGKLAFVFPGSGNQFAGMGRDLSAQFPEILRRQQAENRNLRGQFAPDKFWADAIPPDTTAKEFLFGQVTLGTLTADLLRSLGVRPDAMVGLSLGESAGLFGLRVWESRDEMLHRIRESTLFGPDLGPPYRAARAAWDWPVEEQLEWVTGVLAAPAADVRAALDPGKRAYLLIVNTPTECVVGGLRCDVDTLVSQFPGPFVPLSGVTLAHCAAGRPAERPYRELHTLPTTPQPGLTVYSGARATPYEPTPENAADSITAGLVGTIDFPAVIEAAYRDGVRAFFEVGPGNSCSRMIGTILAGRPHLTRYVTAARQDSVSLVLRTVANLLAEGFPVDLAKLYSSPSACAGHREPPAPPANVVTVPVGLPPRDFPPEPKPVPDVIVVSPPPPPVVDSRLTPAARLNLAPFVTAVTDTQTAVGDAHETFLRVQAGFT
ncbi:MAG: acyltransferase domain-containing protein, partial [Fimbriiglobus sp.]